MKNKHQVRGKANETAGKVQKNVGMGTANGTQAVKGKARELAGKAEKAYGDEIEKSEMRAKRDRNAERQYSR